MNLKIRLKVSAISAVTVIIILMLIPWKQNTRLFCSAENFVLYCRSSGLLGRMTNESAVGTSVKLQPSSVRSSLSGKASLSGKNIKLVDFRDLGFAEKSSPEALKQYIREFIDRLKLVSAADTLILCMPELLAGKEASDLLKEAGAEKNIPSHVPVVGASTFSAVDNAPVKPPAQWALETCRFTGFHKIFADLDEKTRAYPLLRKGTDVYPSLLASALTAVYRTSLDRIRLSTGTFSFDPVQGERKSIPLTVKGDYTVPEYPGNYELVDSDALSSNLVRQDDFRSAIVIIGPVEKGRKVNIPQFLASNLGAGKITDTEFFASALSNILDSKSLVIETNTGFVIGLFIYLVLCSLIYTVSSHTLAFVLYLVLTSAAAFVSASGFSGRFLHFPLIFAGVTAVFIIMRVFFHFYTLFRSQLTATSLGTRFSDFHQEAAQGKKGFPFQARETQGLLVFISEPKLENISLDFESLAAQDKGAVSRTASAVRSAASGFHGCFTEFSFRNSGAVLKRSLGSVLVFIPMEKNSPQEKRDRIINSALADILDTRKNYVQNNSERNIKKGLFSPNPVFSVLSGKVNSGFITINGLDDFVFSGPDTDLAAFLCRLNSIMGTMIISGPGVHSAVRNGFISRKLDSIQFSAEKKGPLQIFEIIGKRKNESDPGLRNYINNYEKALALYIKGDFQGAQGLFEQHIQEFPKDGAARIIMARCNEYSLQAPLVWKKSFDWKRW